MPPPGCWIPPWGAGPTPKLPINHPCRENHHLLCWSCVPAGSGDGGIARAHGDPQIPLRDASFPQGLPPPRPGLLDCPRAVRTPPGLPITPPYRCHANHHLLCSSQVPAGFGDSWWHCHGTRNPPHLRGTPRFVHPPAQGDTQLYRSFSFYCISKVGDTPQCPPVRHMGRVPMAVTPPRQQFGTWAPAPRSWQGEQPLVPPKSGGEARARGAT